MIKRYGVDGARYLLMSATTFGHDGDVGWKFFDEKYNADLANGIGNLVARSVTLAEKFNAPFIKGGEGDLIENWNGYAFNHDVNLMWQSYKEYLLEFKIDLALKLSYDQVVKFLDNYITTTKPWELIKNKDERTGTVMYNILERIRHIALIIYPFMPETAGKIYKTLGLGAIENVNFEEATKWGGLPEDVKVKKGEVLFPRI